MPNAFATWTQEDAVAFRDFLSHHKSFFVYLESKRPKAEGTNMETVALSSKLRDGFDQGLDEVRAMTGDVADLGDKTEFVDQVKN